MAHIELERVCKTFRVTRKQKGLAGAVKGLFRPDRREVHAVRDVSFAIEPSELVGFIGPNGAGKSTTIKMLSPALESRWLVSLTPTQRYSNGETVSSASALRGAKSRHRR